MAKNYTQFIAYVLADFKRDDKNTEIAQAYNDTIRHIASMKQMAGRQFTSWITTTAGQEDYALPTSSEWIIHPARYIEAGSLESGYTLNKLSRQEWTDRYINPNNTDTAAITKSAPVDYCIYENAIHIGPIPDKSTYIIEIDFARLPTEQAGAADVQELGEAWEEVIKWGTLFRLYVAIGLDTEAAKYKALYQDDELGYPNLLRKEENNIGKLSKIEYNDL